MGNIRGMPPRIDLPPPVLRREASLRLALEQRRTTRDISDVTLSLPLLSALLWAAWGVNRPEGPFGQQGRTAASASNSQEIDLYVALAEGTYLYDAPNHALSPVAPVDLRGEALTPGQAHVTARAPVHLIYVVDLHRLTHTSGLQEPGLHDPEVQKSYYFIDAGMIAGNVYLFAAAHGLAAWFHNCNKTGLARDLGLHAEQHALFAQSVGYPARELPHAD